jgi:hypothetical protein
MESAHSHSNKLKQNTINDTHNLKFRELELNLNRFFRYEGILYLLGPIESESY